MSCYYQASRLLFKWNFIMEFPQFLLIGTCYFFFASTIPIIAFKTLTTEAANEASPKEDKHEANKKKTKSAAEKNNKPTSAERKISQMKDLTSETDSKKKEVKKSKTCSIL